jgi:hypothetical protein
LKNIHLVFTVLFCFSFQKMQAQWNEKALKDISLQNLDFFKPNAGNWKIVGKAAALREINHNISIDPGTGVLVNRNNAELKDNLFSKEEFGDLDFQVDFMMPKGSNSGIYFMGRYEIQLFDSWKKEYPLFSDCGGVYQRWDINRGKGKEGYEGVAPISNECKAPGLWQTLKISFEAPRFDDKGKKIKNARFLTVWLNGVKIHSNIEVSGPTRGAAFQNESANGPFMIQGDHGPVAFRNMKIATFGLEEISWKNLSYKTFVGPCTTIAQFLSRPVKSSGQASALEMSHTGTDDEFLIQYDGTLQVPKTGQYFFTFEMSGKVRLLIDGQIKLDTSKGGFWWKKQEFDLDLSQGEHQVSITYYKKNQGNKPYMGFLYYGPGIRVKRLHSELAQPASFSGGQLSLPTENAPFIQRSFFIHKGRKMPYGLSAFFPQNVHFTLNLNTGKILRAWRGKIGDVSSMWYDRGSGQSLYPAGAELVLEDGALISEDSESPIYPDTLKEESGFRYEGYQQKGGEVPIFSYQFAGGMVSEKIQPGHNGLLVEMEIQTFKPEKKNIWHCMAEGNRIEKLEDGSFKVDDAYYVLPQPGIENMVKQIDKAGKQKLLMAIPVSDKKGSGKYELVW